MLNRLKFALDRSEVCIRDRARKASHFLGRNKLGGDSVHDGRQLRDVLREPLKCGQDFGHTEPRPGLSASLLLFYLLRAGGLLALRASWQTVNYQVVADRVQPILASPGSVEVARGGGIGKRLIDRPRKFEASLLEVLL